MIWLPLCSITNKWSLWYITSKAYTNDLFNIIINSIPYCLSFRTSQSTYLVLSRDPKVLVYHHLAPSYFMLVEINCFIYNVLFFNFFLHIELIKLCMSPFPFDSFLAIIYQAFIIIISHNSPNVAVGFCALSSGLFALQNVWSKCP